MKQRAIRRGRPRGHGRDRLRTILGQAPATMAALCDRTGLSKGAVNMCLRRMREAGEVMIAQRVEQSGAKRLVAAYALVGTTPEQCTLQSLLCTWGGVRA